MSLKNDEEVPVSKSKDSIRGFVYDVESGRLREVT